MNFRAISAFLLFPLVAGAAEKVSFNRDIRPILSDKCFHCHGPDEKERKAKLRLDLRDAALKGGENGPVAIVPGKPDESDVLVRVLSRDKDEVMPPPKMHKSVSTAEAALLRRWIAEGSEYQGHWAFIKPERVPPPGATANPIDGFILKKLADQGLKSSGEASKETLIRRVTLDLTGLPPTSDEVIAFQKDNAPGAYERVVDRLLASPRYGEHMAARWLDMARYADSNGFQSDTQRQQWPWRDWVIGALNANMPFDRFTIEQLAGDLLPDATRDQIVATGFNRNHRLNGEGGRIVAEWFAETVIDRVETTGLTWMALTLNCCRCHDHKYDPVTQKEFYQIFAYFNSNDELGVMDEFGGAAGTRKGGNSKPVLTLPTPEQEKKLPQLEAEVQAATAKVAEAGKTLPPLQTAWEEGFRLAASTMPPGAAPDEGAKVPDAIRAALLAEPAKRTPKQSRDLAKFYRENSDNPAKRADTALATAKKAATELSAGIANVMVMRERPEPREAFLLQRGQYDQPGVEVPRAVPAFLPAMPPAAPNNRLGFAQWLVSGEHPLTARVWVNRAWEQCFGAGLVRTTENFGSQAEWPSHPELLDWLATEFVRVKWDMKAMQRLMVTSATYRQSSRVTPEHLEKDPENRLLARAPRLRLPAETMRDQALAVSGLLVEKLGGPSVKPYMPAAVWDETSVYGDMRGYQEDTDDGLYRRTLYTIWKRTAGPPTMLLFDSPSREICTVKRSRSDTPTQALALLNEVTYVEAARRLAERMLTEGGTTPEARIAWAFERVTARKPDAFELEKLSAGWRDRLAFFSQEAEAAGKLIAQGASKPAANLDPAELAACTVTANVLLNLDEVVTRN